MTHEPVLQILIINPNSTASMTESLSPVISNVNLKSKCTFTYFTAPSGPPSINNGQDVAESLTHCISALDKDEFLAKFNGFLVACYSPHPLVRWLKSHSTIKGTGALVIGIFEASVRRSLHLISPPEGANKSQHGWGIVSTGKVWEELLSKAVRELPKSEHYSASELALQQTFVSVETTGLNATELHDVSHDILQRRMMDATRRLLRKGTETNRPVRAICLGCAGMAVLEHMVREACIEELGSVEKASEVHVVDGVQAGAEWLSHELAHR